MDDREKLRLETTELVQRLRDLPEVPAVLWELLQVLILRMDRIETGIFSSDETPTKPERRPTPSPFAKVTEILKGGTKEP